ncbi:ATP-binding protein [Roseomonas sp. BN140053]|uniref:sensor histidine kinase n=1 Tax=Roseomonas sp. BN140053 TaxID=3391898 RepID=UPI0039E79B8C
MPTPRRRALARLLGGAGFRIAAFFAAVFLLAGLAFGAVLWWGTAGTLDRRTDAAIRADAGTLFERWRENGRAAVTETIAEHLAEDVEDQALYLLTDAAGQRLAGNLEVPRGGFDPLQRWQTLSLLREGVRTEARVFRLDLPGGDLLVVGRDVEDKLQLRELLTEGIAWSATAAVLLALIGAWLLRRALEDRLRPAAETAVAIAQGDLNHRVPLSGRDDEFDRLGLTMNAMLDRIAALMAGVRGVSDAIAHDLRTPIARARAKLEEALASAPDTPEGCEAPVLRQAVERGIADLDGIARVFQAVLRIAEVEAGARRAAFARFALGPVLADAAELYGASAEEREQVLSTDIAGELVLVGDRDLILQAVANLLDNAVKFTPPGGTVRLEARTAPGPAGEILAEVAVTDDGPGLTPAERERAGERFFRADRARATPGSGLGLSLVRAVATLHGGRLLLSDARPGTERPGLRAVLALPLAGPPAAAATTPLLAAPAERDATA